MWVRQKYQLMQSVSMALFCAAWNSTTCIHFYFAGKSWFTVFLEKADLPPLYYLNLMIFHHFSLGMLSKELSGTE